MTHFTTLTALPCHSSRCQVHANLPLLKDNLVLYTRVVCTRCTAYNLLSRRCRRNQSKQSPHVPCFCDSAAGRYKMVLQCRKTFCRTRQLQEEFHRYIVVSILASLPNTSAARGVPQIYSSVDTRIIFFSCVILRPLVVILNTHISYKGLWRLTPPAQRSERKTLIPTASAIYKQSNLHKA